MRCFDCPRNCGVDRTFEKGFCLQGEDIKIAKIIENFEWEEDCISKKNLAIFFSGCSLRCEYCQNFEISCTEVGETYSVDEFVRLLKKYKDFDCIDLITPTHFTSKILSAFEIYKPDSIIIWNTSGYEKEENIEKLSKYVDVFLTDFKYSDNTLGLKYSKVNDYNEVAIKALKKMCELKENIFENEFMKQGVIIRHLVLPMNIENSKRVLDIIKENIKDPFVSIMSQFTPNGKGDLNRKLLPLEYKIILNYADKLGFNQGFVQDFCSADENYIPKFTNS